MHERFVKGQVGGLVDADDWDKRGDLLVNAEHAVAEVLLRGEGGHEGSGDENRDEPKTAER